MGSLQKKAINLTIRDTVGHLVCYASKCPINQGDFTRPSRDPELDKSILEVNLPEEMKSKKFIPLGSSPVLTRFPESYFSINEYTFRI